MISFCILLCKVFGNKNGCFTGKNLFTLHNVLLYIKPQNWDKKSELLRAGSQSNLSRNGRVLPGGRAACPSPEAKR